MQTDPKYNLRNPGSYYPIAEANYVREVVYVIPILGLITTMELIQFREYFRNMNSPWYFVKPDDTRKL
jgi:hypothetical protein